MSLIRLHKNYSTAYPEAFRALQDYWNYIESRTQLISAHKALGYKLDLKSRSRVWKVEQHHMVLIGLYGRSFYFSPEKRDGGSQDDSTAIVRIAVRPVVVPSVRNVERFDVDAISQLFGELLSRLTKDEIRTLLRGTGGYEDKVTLFFYPESPDDFRLLQEWWPYIPKYYTEEDKWETLRRVHHLFRQAERLLSHPSEGSPLHYWASAYFLFGYWHFLAEKLPSFYAWGAELDPHWMSSDPSRETFERFPGSSHVGNLTVFPGNYPRWLWIFYLELHEKEVPLRPGYIPYLLETPRGSRWLSLRYIAYPTISFYAS